MRKKEILILDLDYSIVDVVRCSAYVGVARRGGESWRMAEPVGRRGNHR